MLRSSNMAATFIMLPIYVDEFQYSSKKYEI